MRTRPTLGDLLRRTLLGSPLALAALGAPSCGPQYGPCGSQVVIIDTNPVLPDGGVDCSACGTRVIDCNQVTVDGTPKLGCDIASECIGGRRPAALLAGLPLGLTLGNHASVGRTFAAAARLEEASVVAFRWLAAELAAHGAPERLVAWCRRSAVEEARHTELMSSLARRYGARPERPRYGEPTGVRPLEAIAIENAVEGCARETFGAAVAVWQGRRAGDPQVACSLTAIAADELRHAELAWAIADWSAPKLGRGGRARVSEARAVAALALAGRNRAPSHEERLLAGLPAAEVHADLAERFGTELARLA
jgi:hypothetical protein